MSEKIVIMEGGSNAPDDNIINVAETVAFSIEKNPLWSHGFRASPQSCIFTVPQSLSRHNEVAYKPKTFSIGPLHHSDEHLKHSQTIKFQYLRDLVSRVGVQVQELTTAVANLEPQSREHYGEQINLSLTELVEIMVIDGCFLIEYFRKEASTVDRKPNDPLFSMINTAAELENVGVTLKKSEASGLTILFKDGVLEMSPIQIYDETESLYRNIIALEQCSTNYTTTFLSSYVYILDNLIKTTKYINCLSSNEIIKVNVNPDDALGFFNKVGNGVCLREFYFPNISPPLNAYCRRRWPKWRAMLYRNYFSNPWVIISTFAAFVLLVLTCLQTIYTMKK